MKTFKCDACNQYYDKVPVIRYKISGQNVERPTTGVSIQYEDGVPSGTFDLCKECLMKIVSDLNIVG